MPHQLRFTLAVHCLLQTMEEKGA